MGNIGSGSYSDDLGHGYPTNETAIFRIGLLILNLRIWTSHSNYNGYVLEELACFRMIP